MAQDFRKLREIPENFNPPLNATIVTQSAMTITLLLPQEARAHFPLNYGLDCSRTRTDTGKLLHVDMRTGSLVTKYLQDIYHFDPDERQLRM